MRNAALVRASVRHGMCSLAAGQRTCVIITSEFGGEEAVELFDLKIASGDGAVGGKKNHGRDSVDAVCLGGFSFGIAKHGPRYAKVADGFLRIVDFVAERDTNDREVFMSLDSTLQLWHCLAAWATP